MHTESVQKVGYTKQSEWKVYKFAIFLWDYAGFVFLCRRDASVWRKDTQHFSGMEATFYKNRAMVLLLFASFIVAINQSRVLLFDYNPCYLTSCLHQLCVCKEDTGCAPFRGDHGYAVFALRPSSSTVRGSEGWKVQGSEIPVIQRTFYVICYVKTKELLLLLRKGWY